jgi:hypothetical protein
VLCVCRMRRRGLLLPLLVMLLLLLLSLRRRLPRRWRPTAVTSPISQRPSGSLAKRKATMSTSFASPHCRLCKAAYPSGRRTNSQLLTFPSGSGM